MPTSITDFTNLVLPDHVKAVLLDLDNTCYIYEPCSDAAKVAVESAIRSIIGHDFDFSNSYQAAQKIVKSRIPTRAASHSRALYFQTMFENFGRTDGHIYADTLERLYWDTFFTIMKPVSGLVDFLALTRKNGTTIAVISDLTTSIQCEKMRHLGIEKGIDYLITSEEAGVEKPDATIFALTLQKINCAPRDTVLIGDNEEKDIAGAAALGIPAILIHHEELPTPETT